MRHLSTAVLIAMQLLFVSSSSFAEKPGETNEKLGMQAFNKGQQAGAESYLAKAVNEDPKNAEYRWLHATSLIRLGKYAQAIEELKQCTGPNDQAAHRSLIMQAIAECYVSLKDWSKGVKAYEDLSQTPFSKFDPSIMNNLARVYGLAGMKDKALAERKMALRYGYADQDNVVSRCEAFARKGKLAEAVGMAEYSQTNGDQNLSLRRFLAKAYMQQGNFDGGMKEISDCCKVGDLCADNFGIKGELEFNLGRYADAINDLDNAIKLPPNLAALGQKTPDAQIRHWQVCRIACYFRMKKFPEALKSVNALIATKGGAPDSFSLTERGLIYSSMKNFDKAISDFTQVIALDSAHPSLIAYESRGDAYFMTNNFSAARGDAEKIIALAPNAPDGYFFLSAIDMRQQKYKKAVEDLNEAIKHNPNKLQTLYLECRADAHYQGTQYPAAVADYTEAIAIDATKPWLLSGRALAYSKLALPDKAKKDLVSLEALKSRKSGQTKSDSQSPTFLQEYIVGRRDQIMQAASKLKRG
ncbi:MAG: tetratricopeptide repeat protein [Candidatus Obscuribacterales bacterium]|nr:tetratricopeptide repeat protein [Candidatus Obscuribacterales bacterium]